MSFNALFEQLGELSKDNKVNCKKLILEQQSNGITEQMQHTGNLPKKNSVTGKMLGKITSAATDALTRRDYKKNMY